MDPIQNCTFKTKAFTLSSLLQNDTKILTIHLEDLSNGVVFERQYMEKDIGSQIDKRS